MSKEHTNDFGTLIKAIIGNVHRNLHVSSLARVINVGGYDKNGLQVIGVKPFPQRDNVDIISMDCYSICNEQIKVGDIVNIIYQDRDYRGNLKSILNGNDKIYTTNDERLHSIDYGLITGKFSFPKYIKLDTNYDTFDIRLINAEKVGDEYHSPLLSFELLIRRDMLVYESHYLCYIEFDVFSDIIDTSKVKFPSENTPVVMATGMYHEPTLLLASVSSTNVTDSLDSMRIEFVKYDMTELDDFDYIRLSATLNGTLIEY
jgi:hypothetical protein